MLPRNCPVRRYPAVVIRLLAAAFVCAMPVAATADEPTPNPAASDLIGAKVTVELQSGKVLAGMEIVKLTPGKIPGTFTSIAVANPETQKRTTLGAKAVKSVQSADGRTLLAYDATSKALAPTDPDKLAAIHRAAEALAEKSPSAKPGGTPGHATPHSSPANKNKTRSRRPAGKAEEDLDPKEKEARRQAFFKETGVWLWPDLSDEQQKEELAKRKDLLKKIDEAFPAFGLKLYETRYFLFYSNMPPAAAGMYSPYLDQMYQRLGEAFTIKKGTNIFPGRAVILAFARREEFVQFEAKFFQAEVRSAATGLAHLGSDGTVVISCYCHTTPQELASVIVHETTHGFVHRYKSASQLPTWLNEGIAEWVAATVVRTDDSVRRKQQAGLETIRRLHSLGGSYFTTPNLDAWQYGVAATMTDYLIRTNPKGFRELIEQIKMGQKWQDALQKSYRLTPEQLALQFGMASGIPGLSP
jgi:hypothetical protein